MLGSMRSLDAFDVRSLVSSLIINIPYFTRKFFRYLTYYG
jgi:hypothetical protein